QTGSGPGKTGTPFPRLSRLAQGGSGALCGRAPRQARMGSLPLRQAGRGGSMRYVVCYDITDDRRREHLSTILLDFGRRIQESVFLADLDEELAGKMRERVKNVLDVALDRLHIFPLC